MKRRILAAILLALGLASPVLATKMDELYLTPPVTFSSLGTATEGKVKRCSNCQQTDTCASGGSGAIAFAVGGVWTCNTGKPFAASSVITGTFDASGSTVDKPFRSGTSLPGTCSQNEVYNKTNNTAGHTLYLCTSTNTWTQMHTVGAIGTNTVQCSDDTVAGGFKSFAGSNAPAGECVTGVAANGTVAHALPRVQIDTTPVDNSTTPGGSFYSDVDNVVKQRAYPCEGPDGCTGFSAWAAGEMLLGGTGGTPDKLAAPDTTGQVATADMALSTKVTWLLPPPSIVELIGGICNGAAASPGWDLPSSGPAVATCVEGTNTRKAYLGFEDSGTEAAYTHFRIPADWNGGVVDVKGLWRSTATTGNVVWQIATVCVAPGEGADPAFNTAQTFTDATQGSASQMNTFTITPLTMTGCAADEEIYIKFFRDPANASDTIGATALLDTLDFIFRRLGS